MSAVRGLTVVLLAAVTACSAVTRPATSVKSSLPAAGLRRQREPEVQVWGALRAVMHEGKTAGNVALQSIVPGPHSYAVGALSGLRGEVTVLDDEVFVSLAEPGGRVSTLAKPSEDETATLLVRAVVPDWTSHAIDHAIDSGGLDAELEAVANLAGLDIESRIPVVIEGTVRRLEWHVLGGRAPAGENAHHGPRSVGDLSGVSVTLVGFFSRHDEGVFTHMGEHSHFHVVTRGERMTGHVDTMALEPGAVVRVPAGR